MNTQIEERIKELGSDYQLKYKYYILLYNYINQRVDIKKYDDLFLNSSINYIKIEKSDMDVYQLISSDKLNYLYIRNDIYIQNLNNEEKELLKNISFNHYGEKEHEFVHNTLKKVLTLDNGINLLNLGAIDYKNMVENGSLVIGFRYDEFNLGEMSDEEWNDNYEKSIDESMKILISLEQELRENLEYPCIAIHYNEFNMQKDEIDYNNFIL